MTRTNLQTRLFVVDAFTSSQDPTLKGNPAGVLVTSRPLADDEAEAIAKKLALPALAILSDPSLYTSETLPQDVDIPIAWLGPEGHWLPLCGHATMATSLTILQLYPQLSSINFVASRSGRKVKAQRTSTGAGIQFPAAERCHDLELLPYKSIVAGLGTASAGSITADNIVFMGESRSNDVSRANLLVELAASVDLATLPVDPRILLEMPYRGFWLTTPGASGTTEDMRTRVFFPSVGIPEDQVCGSAHTLFGPYWAAKKDLIASQATGEARLLSKQVSPNGGQLGIRWDGKWGEEGGTCWLAGEGKIVDRGALPEEILLSLP